MSQYKILSLFCSPVLLSTRFKKAHWQIPPPPQKKTTLATPAFSYCWCSFRTIPTPLFTSIPQIYINIQGEMELVCFLQKHVVISETKPNWEGNFEKYFFFCLRYSRQGRGHRWSTWSRAAWRFLRKLGLFWTLPSLYDPCSTQTITNGQLT